MPVRFSEEAEFDWLLRVDVLTNIEQLKKVVEECSNILPSTSQQYNLFYSSQNQLDVLKINTTLEGYKITSSDINIKLSSKHPIQTIKTCIRESPTHPFCWRLHQIQDAINHLGTAKDLLSSNSIRIGPDNRFEFKSSEEVLYYINDVMDNLQKSRSSLMVPKKRTIEELQHSQNMQAISPALPLDFSLSFYVQGPNLVCAVYHLSQVNNRPQIKAEYAAEVPVPFLSEMLVGLNLALQTCQQIKNKFNAFSSINGNCAA